MRAADSDPDCVCTDADGNVGIIIREDTGDFRKGFTGDNGADFIGSIGVLLVAFKSEPETIESDGCNRVRGDFEETAGQDDAGIVCCDSRKDV